MYIVVIVLGILVVICFALLYIGFRRYPYEAVKLWNPIVATFSSQNEYTVDDFPFLQEFIDSIPQLRSEYLAASTMAYDVGELSPEERSIAGEDGKWKMLPVKILDTFAPESETVPTVKSLVKKHAGELSTVYYSILEAGKELPIHRGPFKGVVRCHIPIVVPEGDLGLIVYSDDLTDNEVIYRWQEPFVFDDTHRHSAWNRTKDKRVVLLMDIIRPLPVGIRHLNRAAIAAASSPSIGSGPGG